MQTPMLRSLPPIARVIPALILTLITTILLYKFVFIGNRSSRFGGLDAQQCDTDGHCDAIANEDLLKPPTRQEFSLLEHRIKSLTDELEAIKKEPAKELSPDEQRWEARRKECGDGVVRNIDYQHVLSLLEVVLLTSRVSITKSSGPPHHNHFGIKNMNLGKPT